MSDRPSKPMTVEEFEAWVLREMPVGTVIGNPTWWALRIWRQLRRGPQEARGTRCPHDGETCGDDKCEDCPNRGAPPEPAPTEAVRPVIEEVVIRGERAFVLGMPAADHNCDAMDCSSVEHKLAVVPWRDANLPPGHPHEPLADLIEVGELVDIADGLGTVFFESTPARYELPAGTKFYALKRPVTKRDPLPDEKRAATSRVATTEDAGRPGPSQETDKSL